MATQILAQPTPQVEKRVGSSKDIQPDAENRPLVIASTDLLQGRQELWIEHGHDMYRLRLTPSGKLYLTK